MGIIAVIFILVLRSVLYAAAFWQLAGRKISFWQSYRLTVVSVTLNKFLFSASGFIAGSYYSRSKGITAGRTLGVFLILELLSVGGWVILAVYFGGQLAAQAIWIVITLIAVALIVYYRRGKFIKVWDILLGQLDVLKNNILWCGLYAGVDMLLFALYYKFLLAGLHVFVPPEKLLSIIALSFCAGYLSPAPSGLGVKDAALAGLLLKAGVSLPAAGLVVVADRLVMTGFWLILGLLVSSDLLKEVWRSRTKIVNR